MLKGSVDSCEVLEGEVNAVCVSVLIISVESSTPFRVEVNVASFIGMKDIH